MVQPSPVTDIRSDRLTVWCNARFPAAAMAELGQGLRNHNLVFPATLQASNLVGGGADPALETADIALGQPDPEQIVGLPRLRWVHLTSAGYTRYDRSDLRAALAAHGAALTNSSMVYDEPCAEHVLAMMLALARRLPQSLIDQQTTRPWRAAEHRIQSRLLTGQTALIYGYGAIGRRLAELLSPLKMKIVGVRRTIRGGEAARVVIAEEAEALLPAADHVINILPANKQTGLFFGRERIARIKPGASFYNIGRGTTVDQGALLDALRSGRLAAAYLDVTEPEPLPPDHPLWSAPNCYITPHTAGGADDESERLVRHFLENLRRFERGTALQDRIV